MNISNDVHVMFISENFDECSNLFYDTFFHRIYKFYIAVRKGFCGNKMCKTDE